MLCHRVAHISLRTSNKNQEVGRNPTEKHIEHTQKNTPRTFQFLQHGPVGLTVGSEERRNPHPGDPGQRGQRGVDGQPPDRSRSSGPTVRWGGRYVGGVEMKRDSAAGAWLGGVVCTFVLQHPAWILQGRPSVNILTRPEVCWI